MKTVKSTEREYDEELELSRYIWRNYAHARTEREFALSRAAILEIKARQARDNYSAERLRSMPDYFFDADVASIAESGFDSFQRQCIARLVRDYADQIYVNRCERCNRIVTSPIACACLWCRHHWYDRRPEMVARATSSIYPRSNARNA